MIGYDSHINHHQPYEQVEETDGIKRHKPFICSDIEGNEVVRCCIEGELQYTPHKEPIMIPMIRTMMPCIPKMAIIFRRKMMMKRGKMQ